MSMTESDHWAENALAERMNGILKCEYGLDRVFAIKAQSPEQRASMASGSCRNFENIRELRHSLPVFKSVCHDSQSQRLHASKRLIARLTVTQRSRELRNLGNPASILFLL
jgi:hypothetical protein